jgi:hypothetical protein
MKTTYFLSLIFWILEFSVGVPLSPTLQLAGLFSAKGLATESH